MKPTRASGSYSQKLIDEIIDFLRQNHWSSTIQVARGVNVTHPTALRYLESMYKTGHVDRKLGKGKSGSAVKWFALVGGGEIVLDRQVNRKFFEEREYIPSDNVAVDPDDEKDVSFVAHHGHTLMCKHMGLTGKGRARRQFHVFIRLQDGGDIHGEPLAEIPLNLCEECTAALGFKTDKGGTETFIFNIEKKKPETT